MDERTSTPRKGAPREDGGGVIPSLFKGVGRTISSIFKGTTSMVNNLLIDIVDFDGDDSQCGTICQYLNKQDYVKVRQLCCFGIPRKVRGFVWYALLFQPKSTKEIRDLCNEQQCQLYWKNVNEFNIDNEHYQYSDDSEVIDWDVARTFPIGYESFFRDPILKNVCTIIGGTPTLIGRC